MAIGNLSNKVSQSARDTAREQRNPPENEPGFDSSDSLGGDWDSLFDSVDDLGIGGGSGGASSSSFDPSDFGGGTTTSMDSGLGGGIIGMNGSMGLGMNSVPQQQQVEKKPGLMDITAEYARDSSVSLGRFMKELFLSIKNRNFEDWGYYSSRVIIWGGAIAVLGLAIIFISMFARSKTIFALGMHICVSGASSAGVGVVGLGGSAIGTVTSSGQENFKGEPESVTESMDDLTSDEDLFGGEAMLITVAILRIYLETCYDGEEEETEIYVANTAEETASEPEDIDYV